MNLTDLTTELQDRAGDPIAPAGVPAVSRLSGVRQRIRVRRRRQAATAAGIAALSVAAVVLAPSLSGMRADRAPTPATTAPADPLAFAPDVAGDPLVDSGIGAPGVQDLVVRFTPTAANIAVSSYCRPSALKKGDPNADQAVVTLTVNGHELTQGGCSADAGPNQGLASRGDDPQEARAAWATSGLKVGHESVFRLRVSNPEPGFDPVGTIRLGLGIYLLSAPRVESSGVRLPTLLDADGHRYRLVGYQTTEIMETNRRLDLKVPSGRYPAQVLWGVTDPNADQTPRGKAKLLIDGDPGPTSADIGIVVTDALPDSGAHAVRLQADGRARGTMQVAYYVRTD